MGPSSRLSKQPEWPVRQLVVKTAKVLTVLLIVMRTLMCCMAAFSPSTKTVMSKHSLSSSSSPQLASIKVFPAAGNGSFTSMANNSLGGHVIGSSSGSGTLAVSTGKGGEGFRKSINAYGTFNGAEGRGSYRANVGAGTGNNGSSSNSPAGVTLQEEMTRVINSGRATQLNSSGARAAAVRGAVALIAFISRDSAKVLPYSLNNIKRLALMFAKASVVMVENDSTDNTTAVFGAWLQNVKQHHPSLNGEARSYKWAVRKGRDLRVYARARNVYLKALQEPRYADVDLLLVVDTDMCVPWDVVTMEQVINALMFQQQQQVALDAVYAYGACGWFTEPEKRASMAPPYTPGAFARYCDLFALQDMAGKRYVTKRGQSYPAFVKVSWREPVVPLMRAAMNTIGKSRMTELSCASADMKLLGCTVVDGEPVIPVRSAFGGLAVYRASLFRPRNISTQAFHEKSAATSGSTGSAINRTASLSAETAVVPCAYASDGKGDECEHVPLGNCLHERGYQAAIALRLVVSWEKEGCAGPVLDAVLDPQNMLGWGSITTKPGRSCPCHRF